MTRRSDVDIDEVAVERAIAGRFDQKLLTRQELAEVVRRLEQTMTDAQIGPWLGQSTTWLAAARRRYEMPRLQPARPYVAGIGRAEADRILGYTWRNRRAS